MLSTAGAIINTDHLNLLFIYAPRLFNPSLGSHVVSKCARWALYLSNFRYAIRHIAGSSNVYADMMSRWLVGYRREKKECFSMVRRLRQRMAVSRPWLLSPADESFVWPGVADVRDAQSAGDMAAEGVIGDMDEDGIWRHGGRDGPVWIPRSAAELQLRLMVIAHAGTAGHRGMAATSHILSQRYWWEGQAERVRELCATCLHCVSSQTGETRVPRTLSERLHASASSDILHTDYLYIGLGNQGMQYILVLKDDFSGLLWLRPTRSCTAMDACEAIHQWCVTFNPPN